MKGDFSHWKRDLPENLTGVLHQQGRVLLDRDWNDQTRIDSDRAEQTARDVIGAGVAAVPANEPDGFEVTQATVVPADGAQRVELQVRPGRIWADGIPVTLPGSTDTVLRVADYFGPPVQSPGEAVGDIASGDRDAVVLEVSHEALNAFQQPQQLLEPALGGPDTTERIHTRTSCRLYRLGPFENCSTIADALKDDPSKRGRLNVQLQPTINIPGDCPVVAGGGYEGFEHFLYRIEIARLDESELPHFKWSQFNGGLVGRGRLQSLPNRITITANRPAIVNSGINAFYLEIVQWNEERGHWEVTMGADVSLSNGELHIAAVRYGAFSASADTVFFRLWNGIRPVSDFNNPANPTELLDGIQLAFPPASIPNLMPDDFWVFSVRAGEITNPTTLLENATPGPYYHRVPLAELTWINTRLAEIEDCRRRFRPLTNQKLCCTYHIGDGIRTFGDFNCLTKAEQHLPPEGGELCLMPGIHFANTTFTDRVNVRIHGCRDRSWLLPKLEQADQPILQFEGGRNVSVEDLQLVSFAGSCVHVESSENGPPSQVSICRSKMIARTNAICVEEGEDIIIAENTLHLWDTDQGGAVVSLRAEDALLWRNRLIVRPGAALPDEEDPQSEVDTETTPEDPCATDEDLYNTVLAYPQYIATIWMISVFGPPPQPYRAQGGCHLRGGCAGVRVWENRISGGASHGLTLGGSLRHDATQIEDDTDDDGNPLNPPVTVPNETLFAVQTLDADSGDPIGEVPIFLTEGPQTFSGQTNQDGFLLSKHVPGDYRISVGPDYEIVEMTAGFILDFEAPLFTLRLTTASADQSVAFLYDLEVDHNEISRMGLCGIGFTLLEGAEAAPVGAVFTSTLARVSSNDPVVQGTLLLSTLLSPREFVNTTNPIRGLRISQNTIHGNLLNTFDEAMLAAARWVGLGGITLPIVDDLSISENVVRENGPDAVNPTCGIFVAHGNNIDINDNEITQNGPVLDAENYLDRRAQGLRSGIFIRFAGAVGTVEGFRKPALRVRGNRVDQPAGRALTALAFGPVSCDGNSFNSEFTGRWGLVDDLVGGVLILNYGGLHRFFNAPQTDDSFDNALLNETAAPDVRLNAAALRSQQAAEFALPGGETLYNNNQIRLGTGNAGYTSQFIVSLDDLGYSANQSSLFGQNLLFANTVLVARTLRASDSRFTEDLSVAVQPLTLSLVTFGVLANTTAHNQADHCIGAYSFWLRIADPNQILFPTASCARFGQFPGLTGFFAGFLHAVLARDAGAGQITGLSGSLNLGGKKSIGQLYGAQAEVQYLYQKEATLLAQRYGSQDARAVEVTRALKHRRETVDALRVELEIADIAFKGTVTEPGLVAGPRGRVIRRRLGGAKGLRVQHVNRRGKAVGPFAVTDASGFYKFALEEDEAAKLRSRKDHFLRVSDAAGKELDRSAEPVAFDEASTINFTLRRPILGRVNVRDGDLIFTRRKPTTRGSTPLEALKGLGESIRERLRAADIADLETLIRTPRRTLFEVVGENASAVLKAIRSQRGSLRAIARAVTDRPIRGNRSEGRLAPRFRRRKR